MKRLVVALLCCIAPVCHAARPFVTDDARVVDPDHCQIETYYKEQKAYSGSEFWFLPACNQLSVEWTVGGNRVEGDRNLVLQELTLPFKRNNAELALGGGQLLAGFVELLLQNVRLIGEEFVRTLGAVDTQVFLVEHRNKRVDDVLGQLGTASPA